MNSIFKLLEQPTVRDAWNDIMEVLVVERLKEDYIICMDFKDLQTATAIRCVLRYVRVYDDFKEFLNELKDAGILPEKGKE